MTNKEDEWSIEMDRMNGSRLDFCQKIDNKNMLTQLLTAH